MLNECLYTQEKITGSHFWVFKEYPQKSQIWKSETSPIWELGWEFPGWDLSHFAKFGIFMGIL